MGLNVMATTGKLIVIKAKSLQVEFTNAKGKVVKMQIPDHQLSTRLAHTKETSIEDLDGIDVDFDEVQGQPKNVRDKGAKFSNLM